MASGFLINEQVAVREGTLFLANRGLAEEAFRRREVVEAPTDSVTLVAQTLDDLAGAVVRSATFTVTARPPGTASIHSVAQVRAAAGTPDSASTELIVDFQGLRTVSRVVAPETIESVYPWLGTSFGDESLAGRGTVVEFREALAERLLVVLDDPLDPAVLSAEGSVTIPTPPADLELTVNGVRVWFNAGPARAEGGADEFRAEVDVTAALRAAVATRALPVRVELRAGTPGRLGLAVLLDTLKTHTVVFPEGARALEASEEGDLTLSVPLPEASSGWLVHGVEVTVSGSPGRERVLDPGLPLPSLDAELVLDADHSAVVRLPADSLGRLAKLTALRLPVLAGPDGAELSGTLLTDLEGEPGEPLPDGQLGPVTVAAGGDAPAWVTLPFAPARDPEPLWVSIQPSRGRLTWPLALPRSAGQDALLRRRAANGRFKPLSSVAGVATSAASVRVAGEPPPNAPIAPVLARVAGVEEAQPFTPAADGVTVSLRLPEPIRPQGGALALALTVWSAGTLAFRDVVIAYTEQEANP